MAGEIVYWRNTRNGSMRRVANWLATEVGEGRRFQKSDLRLAIPGVEQVDRRMRDLRNRHGWVIQNYRDVGGLSADEHLLVTIGDRVWEDAFRFPPSDSLSSAMKRRVFDRDSNRCVVCGIGAGEEYPDHRGMRARLTVGHLLPRNRGGHSDLANLRTECAICNEPSRHLTESPVDVELVKAHVRELPRSEKQRLRDWLQAGRRDFSDVDRLWMQIRQLPAETRDEVTSLLESLTRVVEK